MSPFPTVTADLQGNHRSDNGRTVFRRRSDRLVGVAVVVLACVLYGPASGKIAEGVTPKRICPVLSTTQANAVLRTATREVSGSKNHCVYAGTTVGRPVLTVNIFPSEGVEFTRIVEGKTKPFVGFLAPGNSMRSLRRNSLIIGATRAYGQKIPGNWGLGRTEFSLQAAEGSSLISVAVIAKSQDKQATIRGMTEVLNLHF